MSRKFAAVIQGDGAYRGHQFQWSIHSINNKSYQHGKIMNILAPQGIMNSEIAVGLGVQTF